jgi:tetratricopeptide (TPR) repeat protein
MNFNVNPESLAYITAGDRAFQQDNYNQAITHYTNAIRVDPRNPYPLSKRGKCYQMTQQYDRALTDLLQSRELDNNFENNQSIGECYLFKQDFNRAVQYFDEALEKLEEIEAIDVDRMMGINYGATKARMLNNQAVCYYNLQRLDNAITCTTKGIQANPEYAGNYGIRGMIYLAQNRRTEAISDLQRAARLGDARANAILAQI